MNTQSNKKCNCGSGGNGKCRNCSKIRMAIMLKNGFKNKGFTTTWFSYLRKNNQHSDTIIAGMIKRFLKQPEYANAVNVLLFYDNSSNEILKTLKQC